MSEAKRWRAGDVLTFRYPIEVGYEEDGVRKVFDLDKGIVYCTVHDPSQLIKDQRTRPKKGDSRDYLKTDMECVMLPISLPVFQVGHYPYHGPWKHPYEGPYPEYTRYTGKSLTRIHGGEIFVKSSEPDSDVYRVVVPEEFQQNGIYFISRIVAGNTTDEDYTPVEAPRQTAADTLRELDKFMIDPGVVELKIIYFLVHRAEPFKMLIREEMPAGLLRRYNSSLQKLVLVDSGASQFYLKANILSDGDDD